MPPARAKVAQNGKSGKIYRIGLLRSAPLWVVWSFVLHFCYQTGVSE